MLNWMEAHNITLRKIDDWRWLDSGLEGEVEGLPSSRGRAMMTNGVIVLVERATLGLPVMQAHWCHWKQDNQSPEEKARCSEQEMEERVKKAQATKRENAKKRLEQQLPDAFRMMERLMNQA
jgi:hypothetical protein